MLILFARRDFMKSMKAIGAVRAFGGAPQTGLEDEMQDLLSLIGEATSTLNNIVVGRREYFHSEVYDIHTYIYIYIYMGKKQPRPFNIFLHIHLRTHTYTSHACHF